MKIFDSPTILFVILIFTILIYIVKISNNDDLIKNHSKDKITDKANLKNARNVFSKTKTSKIALALAIITLLLCLICDFTSIEANIINYISTDIYEEVAFDRLLYLAPIFIYLCRNIVIEVKAGEFLLKYYKTEEEKLEINTNALKSILYKKPKK